MPRSQPFIKSVFQAMPISLKLNSLRALILFTTPVALLALSAPALAQSATATNPYGLHALWLQGDWVAKATLLILVAMSLGSWTILFAKLWAQYRLTREGKQAHPRFWKAPSLQQGIAQLDTQGVYRYIAQSGLDASAHHEGTLTENIDLNTWITLSIQRAVDQVHSRLQNGLTFLATVGSTAPFVGLFGTVWGIYHALTSIGVSGQVSIDRIAGPVGEALIMTALGLAVAVPAVLGYNGLVRRNKVVMESVRSFGADLHAVLIGRRNHAG